MTFDGVLSNRHIVGPTLFVSSTYDQEADSDFDAYPGGFLGVIEGDCSGHSCSYAFRLSPDGVQMGSSYNMVDFDYTEDKAGGRCPVGAHTRRTNPRSSLEFGEQGAFARPDALTNRRRILRRGIRSAKPGYLLESLR